MLSSGYVNMEVLLYIWDQYIIGLDAPGFHDEYLPAIAAIYLMLVKEKLRGSESVSVNSLDKWVFPWWIHVLICNCKKPCVLLSACQSGDSYEKWGPQAASASVPVWGVSD